MSDHDDAPDPMDDAYIRADAMLNDDDARAARRAQVLEAVARDQAAAAASPSPSRPSWRGGGWLAAASVAGLSLLVATQVFQPPSRPSEIEPAAPAAPTPASQETSPAPPAPVPLRKPTPATVPRAASPALVAAPRALAIEPPRQAFPAAAATPSPPPPPAPVVVTGERAAGQAVQPGFSSGLTFSDARDRAASSAKQEPGAAAAPAIASPRKSAPLPERLSDLAVKLRAAAVAGRTGEVEALLDQGAPIDEPDADGNTALMKSIQADRPAAAALLRRQGASLDLRNRAGESARDLVQAKGDPALSRAIGEEP